MAAKPGTIEIQGLGTISQALVLNSKLRNSFVSFCLFAELVKK